MKKVIFLLGLFSLFNCQAAETRTTTTGAIYTLSTNLAQVGEAWKDPRGLIWGDIIFDDEYANLFNWLDAKKACEKKGARLPTLQEVIALRVDLGASRSAPLDGMIDGYRAQVLPHMNEGFWTSTLDPCCGGSATSYSGSYRAFNSSDGTIYDGAFIENVEGTSISARCVVDSKNQTNSWRDLK